jgi:hypothetical protein
MKNTIQKTLLLSFISFILASCASNGNYKYIKSDSGVSIVHYGKTYQVPGADSSTLVSFPNTPFAKDKNYVYYNGKVLINAQVDSFTILNMSYGKDESSVYRMNNKIIGAEPQSFKIITQDKDDFVYGVYSEDDNDIFYDGVVVNDICDKSSFRHVFKSKYRTRFARDNECFYYGEKQIPVRNPKDFKVFNISFSSDGETVFFNHAPLKTASVETFRSGRGIHFGRDDDKCFYKSFKIDCEVYKKGVRHPNFQKEVLTAMAEYGSNPFAFERLSKLEMFLKVSATAKKFINNNDVLSPSTTPSGLYNKLIGETYSYKVIVNGSTRSYGELLRITKKTSDSIVFDRVFPSQRGLYKRVVGHSGGIINDQEFDLYHNYEVSFTNGKCLFTLGNCSYTETTSYGVQKKVNVETEYKNGIWMYSYDINGNKQVVEAIYDLNGMPYLIYERNNKKLVYRQ